jgi:hypothetical protein
LSAWQRLPRSFAGAPALRFCIQFSSEETRERQDVASNARRFQCLHVVLTASDADHRPGVIDYAAGFKSNVEKLRKSRLLRDGHVLLATEFCGQDEADIEDLLGGGLFLELVNRAYAVPENKRFLPDALPAVAGRNQRVMPRVEAAMRLLPELAEFDHFFQSSWLIEHPSAIDLTKYPVAMDNFEKLFETVNGLL